MDWLSVFILDAQTGEILVKSDRKVDVVDCLRFSPDGERVVYSGGCARIVVSDARTGATFCELLGHEGEKTTVCYLPDGKRIASGSGDGTIRIWEVDSDAHAEILQRHDGLARHEEDPIVDLEFLDVGKRLLSVSVGGVCIWDGQSGIRLEEFATVAVSSRYSKFARRCAQFCPSFDERPASLEIWDPRTGEVAWNFQWEERSFCSFDLSPNGRKVGFTDEMRGKGHVIRIFDVSAGNELASLKGHDGQINDVRFSANGLYIATASDDHTVRI